MKNAFRANRKLHILLLSVGCAGAAGLYSLLARAGIWIPCLFRRITGFLCPGCGNTRAALALLRLDVPAAIQANCLFPLEFGYIAWVYLRCCLSYLREGRFAYRPPCPAVDLIILMLVILWGIVRNFL